MKIALDAMGGDLAPMVNIVGARNALKLYPAIETIYLVGDTALLKEEMQKHQLTDPRAVIIHSEEVVTMNESGIQALRGKKKSSIAVATNMVKSGEADAVVSAGNTGAAVAAATVKLRTLKGVERAGISSALPNEHGICQILDAGANPEAKPQHLIIYAVMGAVFAKNVLGVKNPTVGLMSNGEEDEKGTAFTKETFSILKDLQNSGKAPFKFVGNVEGHDLFESPINVVLSDGFTGNIILKSCEATAKAMSKWLKLELKRSPLRIMGAMISKGAFKALKEKSSYEYVGGSPLLGVNGVCIIGHGGSSALAIQNALRAAKETVEAEVNPHIEAALEALNQTENS